MSSSQPSVDVLIVVVTHNSEADIGGLLGTVPAAMGPDLRHHVVVADNASHDATVHVARSNSPEAQILSMERNAGYAAAINAAVDAGPSAASILVLNPDVRLAPNSVPPLVRALRRPGVGVAVPRLEDPSGGLAHSMRRRPSVTRALGEAVLGGRRSGRWPLLGEVVRDDEAYEREAVVDWASGCAMLIAESCWRTTGPWDETFFLYAEETEYCLRAADRGWQVLFTPESRAVHVGGESHDSPRLWAMLVVNKLRLFRRRHGRVHAALFWVALVAGEALRSLGGSTTHRAALAALVLPSRRPPEVR